MRKKDNQHHRSGGLGLGMLGVWVLLSGSSVLRTGALCLLNTCACVYVYMCHRTFLSGFWGSNLGPHACMGHTIMFMSKLKGLTVCRTLSYFK